MPFGHEMLQGSSQTVGFATEAYAPPLPALIQDWVPLLDPYSAAPQMTLPNEYASTSTLGLLAQSGLTQSNS